ncbi:hypothetical protein C5167_036364 [Papaver somniferum]|uniref:Protein SCAR n=1 Tax=Papaver somniferum TaxID=3469 RepID=A0A4Y7I6Z9_PAPSO|nr:protein SCAR3-like isoform X2 [Papaver somniferum]RZC43421.1 hypothetical protein C5167_036364 [Papaver somniferum]
MPLVRVEVRNEYGLGSSELYGEAVEEEEPKAVLQGVSVAGLVGILRQLGDLAQFSSEVFHDLQEQVIATAARSQRIINRVQRIEAALPPVEKAVLAQTNHIHFAYSAGTDWHTNIQATHSHLINSDLPHFILESYEECRNPPRLQLLDKFDIAGPGACLKRYSDPSFFKNALSPSEPEYTEKARRAKKANRRRRKGSRHMNGEISQALLLSKRSDRKQFASPSYGRSSTADTISTFDMSKSDLGGSTSSSDSRSRSGYRDSMSDVNVSVRREEREDTSLLTSRLKIHSGVIPDSKLPNKQTGVLENDLPSHSSQDKTVPSSCSITWDEKIEIVKPICQQFENNLEELGAVSEFQRANPDRDKPESISDESAYAEDILTSPINIYPDDSSYCDSTVPESLLHVNQSDAVGTGLENCATACTMVSEFEPESEYQAEKEENPTSSNLEHVERECRTRTTIEMNAQSSNSSDRFFVFDLSSKKQTSPSCSEAVSSDLIHAESHPTVSIYPELDSSVEAVSCLSTNLPDHSRVNNFESTSLGFNVPSSKASSDDKIINSVCDSQVSLSTKDLVHEESLPAISMCPKPDISVEVDLCSSSVKPDVSRVNNFGSARSYSSSPGFSVPSSKASANDKIINSVCESQVSASTKDLVHEKSLPAISMCPEPDISPEVESYSSTDKPDVSRVNNFGSARSDSSSPGFNVPSSKASSNDKIINSVCKPQVSASTKDLVHEESLPATSICPEPNISPEVESCSITDKPDVSGVNNFGSARSDSSSPGINVPSSKASSNDKIIYSVCQSQVSTSTKDLVHEESLPTISMCPKPDISLEIESCSSTDKPDVSGVNNFESARSDWPSSGFNVPSSKALSDDKIINSVCESQVSTSTKDLVHEESLPAMSMCPQPDISLEMESCSSTDKPDVSGVHNFESARSYCPSPGFNLPSSKDLSDYKIINSVCESQVSASTKDLVHEESLPAISMCPEPDISPEVESCSSTDKPDVSRVNNFGSARSDSSSPGFNVASSKASLDDMILNSVCESQVSASTKDLVHEESLPAVSMCPIADVSLEVESCSSTDIPDVSIVNDFGAPRTESSSSGFDVPSSQALQDHKISNNACEYQVSLPTVSGGKPTLFWTNGDLLGLEPAKPINKSPNATEKLNDVSPDDLTLVNVPSAGAHRGNNEQSSSALLGLSDRISVNIFRRSYTSAPFSSLASGLMKLQETQFSEQKKLNRKALQASPLPSPNRQFEHGSPLPSPNRQFEHGSPVNSVSSSSPPLEHMTLSFQPIDGFETSRLKLRFPDGSNFRDNRHVMLPSFQLVPGPSNSQRDIDYESDDDTFSRLSDYLSDDVKSQHSYSNSEQWETDETPRGEDRDMYDGLRRVLSEESVSSSGEGGSVADSLSGLPNFDSVIPIPSQEERKCDGRDVESAIVRNHMQSLQPPFPGNEEATASPPKSENLQKLNGIEETKKTITSKDDNGEEDLLQQIRTRSINLRRTIPTKPILMLNPTANSKVTAILEKASAIRQVVGSDEEGEDSESWSDQ